MLVLPIETEHHEADVLVVVLGAGNLARMRAGDPPEVKLREVAPHLVHPTVVICFEEQQAELMRLLNAGDVRGALAHLSRGWQYRPDRGDHDAGPQRLRDLN